LSILDKHFNVVIESELLSKALAFYGVIHVSDNGNVLNYYLQLETMRTSWKRWISENGTQYSTICLMNSQKMKEDVLAKLKGNANPDPVAIAEDLLDKAKVEDSIPEIEEMVKIFQKQYPNIANELPAHVKSLVCEQLKTGNLTPEKLLQIVDSLFPGLKITLDQIKNMKCGKYIFTETHKMLRNIQG